MDGPLELSLGDSLTQKIEKALTAASAILVILSKTSVESDWCKRELTAGLVRELEEKHTIVMPCVIDDCTIPLFLRDKLYADLRANPDVAFDLVDRSLARISNPFQDRIEEGTYLTDMSIDWRHHDQNEPDSDMLIELTFVDHGHEWPYVILSQCIILCSDVASRHLLAAYRRGEHAEFLRETLQTVINSLGPDGLTGRIVDNKMRYVPPWSIKAEVGREFRVIYTYRYLGSDTGMDVIVHLGNHLVQALEQMDQKLFAPRKA